MTMPQVVLVTGPAAAGKSTLAARLVERLPGSWRLLAEDACWVARGWGSGLRSVEQEAAVQAAVLDEVRAAHRDGCGTVLEFILYKPPPNPLTAYRDALDAAGIAYGTIALAPPETVVIARMRRRGRPEDLADPDGRRAAAASQLACVLDPATAADLLVTDDAPTDRVVDRWLGR